MEGMRAYFRLDPVPSDPRLAELVRKYLQIRASPRNHGLRSWAGETTVAMVTARRIREQRSSYF